MRLFTHPHKTTQLSRDKFAPLGRAWPKSHAQTVDDFKENLKYFGFELTRLRDSNAWLEDTDIYLRDAHVSQLSLKRLYHESDSPTNSPIFFCSRQL